MKEEDFVLYDITAFCFVREMTLGVRALRAEGRVKGPPECIIKCFVYSWKISIGIQTLA